jgi:mitotic spindle assembly checkpoint protein MAD2B
MSRQDIALDTYQAIVSTFSSLLTVAVHTILYERGIYPADSFTSARKYNAAVRQNRSPVVCKWIADAVSAVESEILKGLVSRVALVVFSLKSEPLERYMFDISGFPKVPANEAHTQFDPQSATILHSVVDLEEQFRAAMQRISFASSRLPKLPDNCTFTLSVELNDDAEAPIQHPQPWIPSEPELQPAEPRSNRQRGASLGAGHTIPIRKVEAGEFALELWIEQAPQFRIPDLPKDNT